MPALARLYTSGVETSKHSGHVFALWIFLPKKGPVAAIIAKKKQVRHI